MMIPSIRWFGNIIPGNHCSSGVKSMFPSAESAATTSAANAAPATILPEGRRKTISTSPSNAMQAMTFVGTDKKPRFYSVKYIAPIFQFASTNSNITSKGLRSVSPFGRPMATDAASAGSTRRDAGMARRWPE